MPIYEYKCLGCGSDIEKMQKLSDAPLEICEMCGGKLEKQWSLSGFQFKGAGWYVTDYANKGKGSEQSGKNDTDAKNAKDSKTEKSSASSNTEKSLTPESTAKTETASKQTNDVVSSSKGETTSKNDKSV